MPRAEFDAITNYDDRYRYELVHEVLVVNPIPSRLRPNPTKSSDTGSAITEMMIPRVRSSI